DSQVSRHDAVTGKELELIGNKKEEEFSAVALSTDAKRLALARERLIRIRDLATGQEVPDLGPQSPLAEAAWSPDGRVVALREDGGGLFPWGPAGAGQPRRLVPPEGGVFLASFSADGKFVALNVGETGVRILDAATGEPVREVNPEARWVKPVGFVP